MNKELVLKKCMVVNNVDYYLVTVKTDSSLGCWLELHPIYEEGYT